MAKTKSFRSTHSAILLITVLVFLLIGVYFLTSPTLKNTQLYKDINNIYQENVWATFTSNRAGFSFRHPLNWPVTPASDKQLRENNQDFIEGKWIVTDNE